MRWRIAAAALYRCGSCGNAIGAGEAFGLVTNADLRRCTSCMKAAFGADPPAEIWTDPTPPLDVTLDFAHRMAARGTDIRDGKLEALTDHDK